METEPEIIQNYVRDGRVKIVYRHLLQLGEGALRASEANECAGDQGKYWEMRDLLYRNQYGDQGFAALAQQIGLDAATFNQCLDTRQYKAAVEADFAAAQQRGITGRPVFDINGTLLVGSQRYARFQSTIEGKLK